MLTFYVVCFAVFFITIQRILYSLMDLLRWNLWKVHCTHNIGPKCVHNKQLCDSKVTVKDELADQEREICFEIFGLSRGKGSTKPIIDKIYFLVGYYLAILLLLQRNPFPSHPNSHSISTY